MCAGTGTTLVAHSNKYCIFALNASSWGLRHCHVDPQRTPPSTAAVSSASVPAAPVANGLCFSVGSGHKRMRHACHSRTAHLRRRHGPHSNDPCSSPVLNEKRRGLAAAVSHQIQPIPDILNDNHAMNPSAILSRRDTDFSDHSPPRNLPSPCLMFSNIHDVDRIWSPWCESATLFW